MAFLPSVSTKIWLRPWPLLLFTLFAGCSTPALDDAVIGADYTPENVYRASPRLDPAVRHVAVLPLTTESRIADGDKGIASMEPVLHAQLARQNKFELTMVTPEQLREWTGRSHWTAEEELPANFFEVLRQKLHCDAVLFSRLTQYQPYPPMALGWRLKLIDSESCQALWAVDEVFDARDKAVANSARRYQQSSQVLSAVPPDSKVILTSPGRFAGYSVEAALRTLPTR